MVGQRLPLVLSLTWSLLLACASPTARRTSSGSGNAGASDETFEPFSCGCQVTIGDPAQLLIMQSQHLLENGRGFRVNEPTIALFPARQTRI